jgi:predicted TPR repeat methyltransferase
LDEAVAYYRQVVQDKPEFHDAYGALSSALLEAGRPQEALDWHRRALDRNPDDPAAHFYLSRTLLMLGQLEAAEAALRRVLEIDPRSGDAYKTLGRVLESLDKREELAALAEQWVQASPDDPQAAHFRAAWTGQHVPPRASDDHVRRTFDSFAAEFDEALGHLDYRAPQLLQAALHAARGNAGASLEILDAGCGTGLCGSLLRPLARRLVGVDLSRGMLDKARGRRVYDELIEAELTDYLQRCPLTFDAIVAADTLVYFGDLAPVIAAAAAALRGRGILAFTLEHLSAAQDNQEFCLEPHGRYSHSESYIRQVLAASGLAVRSIEPAKLRQEGDRDVMGLVVLAIRADGYPVGPHKM